MAPRPWRLLPTLAALAGFLWFAGFVPAVVGGAAPELALPWVPALGVELAFRLDGLALAFALLITGIGALVFLYAATYFRDDRRLGSLLLTLVAFAVSMLGLVLRRRGRLRPRRSRDAAARADPALHLKPAGGPRRTRAT